MVKSNEPSNHQFCTPNLDTFLVLRKRDFRVEGYHGEKRPRARFDESLGNPPHPEC